MVEAALEATQLVLAEMGYEATNTTRIAKRAGMSVGSLYQYFPNRDALIAELQRRHHEHTSSILENAFAEVEDMGLERAVHRLVSATVELHRHEPELHRVLTEVVPQTVNQTSRAAMSAKIDAAQARWFESLAKQIAFEDPMAAALVLREVVEGSIHRAVLHEDPSKLDQIAAEVERIALAYLKSFEHKSS